jgi:hypothetical protein
MDRRMFILTSREKRQGVARIVSELPKFSRVEVKGPKRTLPQNDRLWAMLTEFSEQAEWAGKKRTTLEWKDLLTGAVKIAGGGVEAVPGLEGGIMLLGLHTSDMTVAEMGELIDYMEAKGAELGVVFDSGRDAAGDNLAACAA